MFRLEMFGSESHLINTPTQSILIKTFSETFSLVLNSQQIHGERWDWSRLRQLVPFFGQAVHLTSHLPSHYKSLGEFFLEGQVK